MSEIVEVRMFMKPGCHLCDDARAVVTQVLDEVGESGLRSTFAEIDILEDPGLQRRYGEEIPVVFVADRRVAQWHIDPQRLRAALERAAAQ
ncbi:glutaredoxin family protein [Pseudoclavibacter soli]|uniref:glutaredoxin family protein n=1 Tax=Pseudoclavibacter soli TaxID=452623 RepID=UPI00040DDB1B|nr:glutaredoxin family protein [Pseudoclavibacter soli]